MKNIAPLLLLFLSITVSAQKEANNWFFGFGAGIHFLDDGSVQPLAGSKMNTAEGCSSISDSNGNLLFYTDGRSVWDRNHVLMPNGDYFGGTGLLGDPSSTQSGIIVPKKNDPNIYYIFTVDEPHNLNASTYPNQYTGFYGDNETVPGADDGFNNGLNYSILDLSITGANGSIGDIVTRNIPLQTYDPNNIEEAKYKCSEKVTAVKNKNGIGFWVVTQFIDKFYSFLVDANGVTATPVITQITPVVPTSGYRRNAIGCIKASPNGKFIAIAHEEVGTVTGGSANNGVVYLYNFDNATGRVSNPVLIASDVNPYGLEFSPKAKKLYVSYDNPRTDGGEVHQYDLESTDIAASDVNVHTGNTATTLQLGPNGKIYKAINSQPSLDVINDPEENGDACNYESGGVRLSSSMISVFGLPPFITSLFSASIEAENLCLNDFVSFKLNVSDDFESVTWNFGDGTTSVERTPEHQYKTAQAYTVTATIVRDGETEVVTDGITIIPLPPDVQNAVLVQCGLSGNGTTQFNLTQADAQFTAGDTNLKVTYFTDATTAGNNTNVIAGTFTNTTNPQVINARVTNAQTGCYRVLPLTLSVNFTTIPSVTLKRCDDDGTEDGLAAFDLALANVDGGGNVVAYYPSGLDALTEQNEITDINNFTNTTPNQQSVYARTESNTNECTGLQEIILIVKPLPNIEVNDTATVCVNTKANISIDAATTGALNKYTYLWSTGAKTRNISVNEPGTYTVMITDISDSEAECGKLRTVTVIPSNIAIINDVVVQDLRNNNTVTINASPTGGVTTTYLYSVNAPDGPWQESSHFENVEPGIHTVYVYEPNGCGVVKQQISVLSIPNFFTPNGDGSHDYWHVIGINASEYSASKIYVFDQYGRLVADVNTKGQGWDGQYNGRPLPSTDYWYQLLLTDGRTVKGHFSLVR